MTQPSITSTPLLLWGLFFLNTGPELITFLSTSLALHHIPPPFFLYLFPLHYNFFFIFSIHNLLLPPSLSRSLYFRHVPFFPLFLGFSLPSLSLRIPSSIPLFLLPLSPSGCTFWGKKPWTRKKKILWQLGTLIGAPVGITLIAGIAVPAMVIGIPVYAGRKVCKNTGRWATPYWNPRSFGLHSVI